MVMFERYRKDRALELLKQTTRRLMSTLGEANAQSIAIKLIDQYERLDVKQRYRYFDFLASDFNPEPAQVKAAAKRYASDSSPGNLMALFHAVESPRQELLRRINRAPNGTHSIVKMREALLTPLKDNPSWVSTDADMRHLLGSWFNPGFLELHEVTWSSPALLLERIIRHEAVHAINGWDELRRRLQPDRRCFAFFHRQLPEEPLIFVEVALMPSIAREVSGLLNKDAPVGDPRTFKAAIFYSISNCQPGLKGVSMGNFLIKRVAEKLAHEIPTLKTYATLSPVPGFTAWLEGGATLREQALSAAAFRRLAEARAVLGIPGKPWSARLLEGWHPDRCDHGQRESLICLCAAYLSYHTTSRQGDPVAHFHLSNGASLHQLNWAADLSRKGLSQSAGLMVNYLYDLRHVEEQHEAFSLGQVIRSKSVAKLA
jgi:malonyl-CoA decarboxylase